MLSIMYTRMKSQDGIGLVSAMLALSLLAVFAMVAASLAVNEKRTAFNEMVHTNAFISADSGGEEAIGWLRRSPRPPVIQDINNSWRVKNNAGRTMDAAHTDQSFSYDIDLNRIRPRPGYDIEKFKDFFYDIEAHGEAGVSGASEVGLLVSKLSLMNYN